MTTISWLTMQPSGQVIRQVSTRGPGIHPGTIAVMAGMVAGTTPGIHHIIIIGGAMVGTILGTILGTTAIMAGTILGIMALMVGMIPIIMAGVIVTGEAAISLEAVAMPIII